MVIVERMMCQPLEVANIYIYLTNNVNVISNLYRRGRGQNIPPGCNGGSNCTQPNETRRDIQNAKWNGLCVA
jgi:hypothetical protein